MPPITCPGIFCLRTPTVTNFLKVTTLGIIPCMSSLNIIKILVALALGITLGLVYGWIIEPVEYTDVPPNILREDYRVDYTLMVAEAYQNDFDTDTAARRLAVLGSEPPATLTSAALEYANRNSFNEVEIQALQDLLSAMQTYNPQGSAP